MTYGIIIRDGSNVQRTITAIQVRDGTNTERDISEVRVRDSNNVSRIVFALAGPLSAVASPSFVSGFSHGSGTVTTNATSVTPSGGTAPYTYAWSLEVFDGDGGTPVADSPTAATTTFTQTGLAPGGSALATWSCLVTDADSNTASAECTSAFQDT